MATVPATPKAKTKAGSFHGVPVWVIAIGGVGVAYLGWRWYKSRSSAAATESTTGSTSDSSGTSDTGYGAGTGGGDGGGDGWANNPTPPYPPPGVTPRPVKPKAPVKATKPTETKATAARDALEKAAKDYHAHPTPSTKEALDKAAANTTLKPGEVKKLEDEAHVDTSTGQKAPANHKTTPRRPVQVRKG